MRILSFDTSTEILHLALLESDQVVLERSIGREPGELSEAPRQEAVSRLLPSIDAALKEAQWPKNSLDLIVVTEGPGGFTGIRTGIVTARTLAQALSLPLIAVCALESMAVELTLPAAVVLFAGRGHYFVGGYESAGVDLKQPCLRSSVAPTYVAESEMLAIIDQFDNVSGDEQSQIRLAQLGRNIDRLPNVKNIATRQAQIAWNRLSLRMSGLVAAGQDPALVRTNDRDRDSTLRKALLESFPYSTVEPLYLRSPSITIKRPAGDKTHGN